MKKKTLLLMLVSMLVSLPIYATPIPDTGQTKCYDNEKEISCPSPREPFYGQDAQHNTNVQSYTDLGNGIVRDNLTGLEWVQDGNLVASRDPEFDMDGTSGDGMITWQNALQYVAKINNESYLGYTDWRLPSIKELSTLVDSSEKSPLINTTYFSNTESNYWSSTVPSYNNACVLGVKFNNGYVTWDFNTFYKPNNNYARFVRGNSLPDNNLVDNGDGTVTDISTGLMWQQEIHLHVLIWEEALAYCEGLKLADYDDWRLPNRNELQSIMDYSRDYPSVNTTYFPDMDNDGTWFWSSTSETNSVDSAWKVSTGSGSVYSSGKQITGHNTCCWAVRSGICGFFGDSDLDAVCDDGDTSGTVGDNTCIDKNTGSCDDNCPDVPNPDQGDLDGDGKGDVCDADKDGDSVLNEIDDCPNDPYNDLDNDTICGNVDNCPLVYNPDQEDFDNNSIGNVCDPDDAFGGKNEPCYSDGFCDEGLICIQSILKATCTECPFEAILEGDQAELEVLRAFRDERLMLTKTGQEIAKKYYGLAPFVNEAIENNPVLKEKARPLIKAIIPIIEMMY